MNLVALSHAKLCFTILYLSSHTIFVAHFIFLNYFTFELTVKVSIENKGTFGHTN